MDIIGNTLAHSCWMFKFWSYLFGSIIGCVKTIRIQQLRTNYFGVATLLDMYSGVTPTTSRCFLKEKTYLDNCYTSFLRKYCSRTFEHVIFRSKEKLEFCCCYGHNYFFQYKFCFTRTYDFLLAKNTSMSENECCVIHLIYALWSKVQRVNAVWIRSP